MAFTGLGALSSLLLAAGIWLAARDVSERLMDQTLTAELEDYINRHARNPASLPPAAAGLRGYLVSRGTAGDHLPQPLRDLPPGQHEVELDGIRHRVAVAERNGDHYVILFDEQRQHRREQRFIGYLMIAAATMTLFSAIGSLWLARRVIAPVTRLARTMGQAAPERPPQLAHALTSDDETEEVAALARAFDRYVARLAAFVERERNFSADASHELRTPLAVIRGAVEMLSDDPKLDEVQRRRVARIERAAAEMIELIDTFLMLAREEVPATTAHCDAAQIAIDCVERYRTIAAGNGSKIELNLAAATGDRRALPVPASLFAIVLANLLRNAVTHTRAGQVTVELDDQRLVVSDTGSGIPDAARERVFDRYYRGPDSKGSGIGLSLVKRICERVGWTISLHSDIAAGTVATVTLRPDRELTIT